MKRSKMFNEILTILMSYENTDNKYYECEAKEQSQAILDKIEELGMMPPSISNNNIKDCGNFWEYEE